MANSRCATCKHFGRFNNGQGQPVTVCERVGPEVKAQALMTPDGTVMWSTTTAWVTVNADNGCGHHQIDILRAN